MTATATVDKSITVTEYFERIPIAKIVASQTNPRTHFNTGYIEELARSIFEKGLIQPIVVRPLDIMRAVLNHPEAAAKNGAKFEIVAGECRYRASVLAKQPTVPAIVREYSDEQVLEVQLIENIHRTDLTPLEQAAGYRRLIDTNPTKHSAESIATRIGMSVAYVWDRLKLNDLVPEAKLLLEEERIGVGHAILVSRLKPEQQTELIQPAVGGLFVGDGGFDYDEDKSDTDPYYGMKPRSVREVEKWIADHIRFDVAHAAAAVPLQFEEVAARVEEASAKPGRGKKVIAITFDSHVQPDARDESERTFTARAFKFADGVTRFDDYIGKQVDNPTCEYSVLGVVATGSESYGQAFEVCVARDRCQVHWKKEIAEKEKNAKLREKGQTKKAAKREESWREKQDAEDAKREQVSKQWKKATPDLIAACVGRVKTAKLAFLTAYLVEHDKHYPDAVEFLGKPKTADDLVRAITLSNLIGEAANEWSGPREFPPIGKRFGIDVAAILKQHAPAASAAPATKKAGKKRES